MMKNSDAVVLIAHAVDTEGPLYESFEAKFERLNELFNIRDIKPTRKNFDKLLSKIPWIEIPFF